MPSTTQMLVLHKLVCMRLTVSKGLYQPACARQPWDPCPCGTRCAQHSALLTFLATRRYISNLMSTQMVLHICAYEWNVSMWSVYNGIALAMLMVIIANLVLMPV